MSDKRIFRSLLSVLISATVALPMPLMAQQRTDAPALGLMGTSLVRPGAGEFAAPGTIARLKIEGRDVTVTAVEVNEQNAEAIADAMVASSENTLFAVNDGPDRVRDMIQKKPWYRRFADKVQTLGRVTETAALHSDRAPVSARQKLLNFFRNEKTKRAEEWKGVAYSIAIGGVNGAINYYVSGDVGEAAQTFGLAFFFAMWMTTGEHSWARYLEASGNMLKFIATAGGKLKYTNQVESAIKTSGELFGSFLANSVYALAMHFIDGSASFASWQLAKETMFTTAATAYLINGQVIDITLQRWLRTGAITHEKLKKYMVIPTILLGGAILDGMNLAHMHEAAYVAGTIVTGFVAYAYAGAPFEKLKAKMQQAYKDFRARHRGQFFRPHARAASVCASLLGAPGARPTPMMAPVTFAFSYAR